MRARAYYIQKAKAARGALGMHSCLYNFLRDQGSLIAGILALIAALIAGFWAYSAGKMQVRAAATAEANANSAAAEAVIREVMECNKLVIEALRICGAIYSGKLPMKRRNASSIMINPDPIVYKSVANRIARFPFDAQLIIQFYLRIVYVQQILQNTVFGSGDDSALIPREEAKTIANTLIITCQLAKAIVLHAPRTNVAKEVSQTIIGQIDAALESAKHSFS